MFFDRFAASPPVHLTADDVLPQDSASKEALAGAIYRFYAQDIRRRTLDGMLAVPRQKALAGALDEKDLVGMNDLIEIAKQHARHGGFMMPLGKEPGVFYAYARVKSYAMLVAQVLFVNNAVQEGLLARIAPESMASLDTIAARVTDYSRNAGPSIGDDEARFFAVLFILQTVFDRTLLPEGEILRYDPDGSGRYSMIGSYEAATAYLELSNRRIQLASDAERRLCFNITSGWSEGIDGSTWDKLNTYYYEAMSPLTGRQNLFTAHYDLLLERMLPQFRLSKLRLAEAVAVHASERTGKGPLRVVEIGAGSGAIAIDLFMALKRLGVPAKDVEYVGVEPSAFMRNNFRSNAEHKLGTERLPGAWRLEAGSLETVTATPGRYGLDRKSFVFFSYCIHHCFSESVHAFLDSRALRETLEAVHVLDVVREHGWTKPYYMWADCESPENFGNVSETGIWTSKTLWTEPSVPLPSSAVTNAWCCLRRLS